MKKIRYGVKGMMCAACVSHVERAAKAVLGEGQIEYTVSLLTNSLSVTYPDGYGQGDIKKIEKKLAAKIKSAGYALIEDADQQNAKNHQKQDQVTLVRFVVSACLTGALMFISMGNMFGVPFLQFFSEPEYALLFVIVQMIQQVQRPVCLCIFLRFRHRL